MRAPRRDASAARVLWGCSYEHASFHDADGPQVAVPPLHRVLLDEAVPAEQLHPVEADPHALVGTQPAGEGDLLGAVLARRGATGGLLPKVIAAYNAGPVPVERWNATVRDGGDPLLWIESLPYWETRGYVPTILRNYWVYQRAAGEPSPSLVALSQGKWPLFPSVGNRVAKGVEAGQVRLNR